MKRSGGRAGSNDLSLVEVGEADNRQAVQKDTPQSRPETRSGSVTPRPPAALHVQHTLGSHGMRRGLQQRHRPPRLSPLGAPRRTKVDSPIASSSRVCVSKCRHGITGGVFGGGQPGAPAGFPIHHTPMQTKVDWPTARVGSAAVATCILALLLTPPGWLTAMT
jgi:hypothetical protein